jgi:hypothetical protein
MNVFAVAKAGNLLAVRAIWIFPGRWQPSILCSLRAHWGRGYLTGYAQFKSDRRGRILLETCQQVLLEVEEMEAAITHLGALNPRV